MEHVGPKRYTRIDFQEFVFSFTTHRCYSHLLRRAFPKRIFGSPYKWNEREIRLFYVILPFHPNINSHEHYLSKTQKVDIFRNLIEIF